MGSAIWIMEQATKEKLQACFEEYHKLFGQHPKYINRTKTEWSSMHFKLILIGPISPNEFVCVDKRTISIYGTPGNDRIVDEFMLEKIQNDANHFQYTDLRKDPPQNYFVS